MAQGGKGAGVNFLTIALAVALCISLIRRNRSQPVCPPCAAQLTASLQTDPTVLNTRTDTAPTLYDSKPTASAQNTTTTVSESAVQQTSSIQPYNLGPLPSSEKGFTAVLPCANRPQIYTYDPAKDYIAQKLKKKGLYEKGFVLATVNMLELVPPGCTKYAAFADLGTNVGVFTFCVASAGYKVMSFEATPPTAARISASTVLNHFEDRMHLYLSALDAPGHPESVCMVGSAVNMGATQVTYDKHTKVNCATPTPLTTLDELMPEWRGVLHMKIDVEGFEASVLKGAPELLKRTPPCMGQMEISKEQFNPAAKYSYKVALQSLSAANYDIYRGDVISTAVHKELFVPQLVPWRPGDTTQRKVLAERLQQWKKGHTNNIESWFRDSQAVVFFLQRDLASCLDRVVTAHLEC
eukprot:TRINITY_DN62609_c0_g3_i1.p1 TRINITY_DN62609_c0_g3~~TRINITY_DN62609_c0_g3_i1.p1  ORF type:complete len:410 (-),score=21.12 TRINITY_DN62609_c0_g3_i1:9-1238(-)